MLRAGLLSGWSGPNYMTFPVVRLSRRPQKPFGPHQRSELLLQSQQNTRALTHAAVGRSGS